MLTAMKTLKSMMSLPSQLKRQKRLSRQMMAELSTSVSKKTDSS